jgi:hypothetical protein
MDNIFERAAFIEDGFTDLEREKEGISMWN